MLPVSGAWQLKTSDPMSDLPITSAHLPYSTLDMPDTAGRKRFQSPSSFAFSLSGSSSTDSFHASSFVPK
jgi:hypothetical protein